MGFGPAKADHRDAVIYRRTAEAFRSRDLKIVADGTQRFEAASVMRYEGGRQIERWFYLADLPAFDRFFSRFD